MAGTSTAGVQNPLPQDDSSALSTVACTICQKTYARIDHLARHVRTHTKEKPFTCNICHKSFSRIDVLRRHTDNHDTDRPTKRLRRSSQPTQNRVSRACKTCAESKLKCSDNRPCERCVAKGIVCDRNASSSYSQHRHEMVTDKSQHQTDVGRSHDQIDESSFAHESTPLLQEHIPSSTMIQDPQPMQNDSNEFASSPLKSFQDMMMIDFMSNMMNQEPFDPNIHQQEFLGTLPDILDFSFDEPFDLMPSDFIVPYPTNDQVQPNNPSGTATPSIQQLVSRGQQAFKESMWLWTPRHGDNAAAQQEDLSLPTPELVSEGDTLPEHRLSLSSRDRILSLVLRTCTPSVQRRVVSCFPSAEILSNLLGNFLAYHSHQVLPWIHLPSLHVDSESEEFLLALIASGAANSSYPNVRKLGFAMQESLRSSIPDTIETDNRMIRDLRTIQAFTLCLDIALWSGNRRKMEIAESFAYPIITMVRRGDKFKSKMASDIFPALEDDPSTTESKWKRWINYESFKRIAYQLFLKDTGTSFAFMTQPLTSYTELGLDVPCSQDLWHALSAEEWKQRYLAQDHVASRNMPQLRSVLEDLGIVSKRQASIDVQMTLAIVVSTIWSRVWQCLQLKSLATQNTLGPGSSNTLTYNIYQQELVHLSKHISLRSSDWRGGLGPYASLLLELCMLHLHVSLEAVQSLAGRNGEEEARKVVPTLRKWIDSAESRQAIFHAGQILLAAQRFPFGHLRGSPAVAVYHASLAIWAYAVLSETSLRTSDGNGPSQQQIDPYRDGQSVVLLDSLDGSEIQRFLVLGIGRPAICSYSDSVKHMTSPEAGVEYILLGDTLSAMNSIANLLAIKNGDERSRPPMVSNLNKLMHALGRATAEIRKKGT